MIAEDNSLAALRAFQSWLAGQKTRLAAGEWQRLCDDLDPTIDTLSRCLAQRDFAGIERTLRAIEICHHVKLLPSGRQELGDNQRDHDPLRGHDPLRAGESGAAGDVLRGISKMLSFGRAPVAIETHPEVRMPEEVAAQTTFAVLVSTQALRTNFTAEKVSFTRPHNRPLDFEIEIIAPPDGGLEVRSPKSAVLRVADDGRSAAISFEVFASQPGTHAIEVAFRNQGVECLRLTGDIAVRASDAVPSTATSAIQGASLSPVSGFAGLLLQLDLQSLSAEQKCYQVVLSGALWAGPALEGTVELPANSASLLADLCREITAVMKLEGARVRELRLRAIGAALSSRVLPPQIWDALRGPWPEGTQLHIEGGELNIPWELLCANDGGYLGERFALTRYPRLGVPRDVVGGQRAVLVTPQSSGLHTRTERDAIDFFAGTAPSEVGALQSVQEIFTGSAPCNVLHLACHGDAAPGKTFGDILQLDGGSLAVVDVVAPRRGQSGPLQAGLVFLNACRAAASYPALWGSGGWTAAFLRAGAGACIAPLWTITNDGAAYFADQWYRQAAAGCSLGEAARLARVKMARQEEGNTDRLGYAVFASPNSRSAALVRSAR